VQHHRQTDIEVIGVFQTPHRGESDHQGNRLVGNNGEVPTGPYLLDRACREIKVATVANVGHHLKRQVYTISQGKGVQLEAPNGTQFGMSSSLHSQGGGGAQTTRTRARRSWPQNEEADTIRYSDSASVTIT